ncbi:hypothetical protein MBLNU457_5728t1 [Dothideomycetes sp. NU457]
MADGSSPGSPLSSVGSDEDIEEETITPNRSARPSTDRHASNDGDSTLHPNKRRRTGLSTSVNPLEDRATPSQIADDDDALSDISEDTFSSAPGSPSHDEYALRADQVTSCQWDGCPIGELGDADSLILHVQTEHISPKRAKYTCEWGDCARKGINHPSGYALKAHMRSHTKEKPFFCALPECDRSFTRSDALAKHMRTVHEPELPKASATNANPIDPLTGQPKKGPKLRLTANGGKASPSDLSVTATRPEKNPANAGLQPGDPEWDPSPPNDNIQYVPAHHPITGQAGFMITYPPDINLTTYETDIPANVLMLHLQRQLYWAQQEAEELKGDIEELEEIRREEWVKKEILLEATMSGELAHAHRKGLLSDMGRVDTNEMESELNPIKDLKWTRDPWWKSGDQWTFPKREESPDSIDDFSEEKKRDIMMRAVDVFAAQAFEPSSPPEEDQEERQALPSRSQPESAEQAKKQQAEADTMAVEALMGLSGAAGL